MGSEGGAREGSRAEGHRAGGGGDSSGARDLARKLPSRWQLRYFVLVKPRRVLSMRGAERLAALGKGESSPRRDVYDTAAARGFPTAGVGHSGRLDFETSGTMLMTDDAALAAALKDPAANVAKEYRLTLRGRWAPDDWEIMRLSEPLEVQGKVTQPAEVLRLEQRRLDTDEERPGQRPPAADGDQRGWATELYLRINEGKNRQIRRLCTRSKLRLLHLHRVRFGPLTDEGMPEGSCRWLTDSEIGELYAATPLGADARPSAAAARRACIVALWKRAWRHARRQALERAGLGVGRLARRRRRQEGRQQRRLHSASAEVL